MIKILLGRHKSSIIATMQRDYRAKMTIKTQIFMEVTMNLQQKTTMRMMKNTIKGSFSFSTHVENDNGFTWWLTAVYGPARSTNIDLFWDELNKLQNICNPSWLY